MMKKFIAVSFVALLCISSLPFILMNEPVEAETKGILHPYFTDSISVSVVSIEYRMVEVDYEGGHYYEQDRRFGYDFKYYLEDPLPMITEYVNGERGSITQGKSYNELIEGVSYWAVYFNDNNIDSRYDDWNWTKLWLKRDVLFFPTGIYTIECTSNNMGGTQSYLSSITRGSESSKIKDGNGTIQLDVARPMTYYLYSYASGPSPVSDEGKFSWTMEYKITPSLPEQKIVDCTKSIKVGTDKYWEKYELNGYVSSGTYGYNNSSGRAVLFVTGSTEEREFFSNVVEKGIADLSGYTTNKITLTSSSRVTMYVLNDGSSSYRNNKIRLYDETTGSEGSYSYDYTAYEGTKYEFYAGNSYSIAVEYDTSKYSWAILRSNESIIYMESGKLYDVSVIKSSSYSLSVVTRDSSVSIDSADIMVYTENVSDPDDNGVIFAAVSIGFCAIAFFLLFHYGRRPRWKENTGLPPRNVEEVYNRAPEIPEDQTIGESERPPKE